MGRIQQRKNKRNEIAEANTNKKRKKTNKGIEAVRRLVSGVSKRKYKKAHNTRYNSINRIKPPSPSNQGNGKLPRRPRLSR